MSFCYSNNGQSMRAVDADYQVQTGQVLFADYATEEQLLEAFPAYADALKQQKIEQLNAEYQPLFDELSQALGKALLENNQDTIDGIRADYTALKEEYAVKLGAIE